MERIRQFIIDRATDSKSKLQAKFSVKPKFNNAVTSHIIAGAILAILNWWLENPDELTPEELQDQFTIIITQGIPELLILRDEHE